MTRLVLASASPRRRELLAATGRSFAVMSPDSLLEESFDNSGYKPKELAARLAKLKAENVASRLHEEGMCLVLGCDSIAVCRGQILGKPLNRTDAERMLRLLSGSRHEVHTGICLIRLPDSVARLAVETSVLVMEQLDEEQLQSYLDSGLWQGKAGAFGWQDGNDWLRLESGSPSNVVGLPLEKFEELWTELAAENDFHPDDSRQ